MKNLLLLGIAALSMGVANFAVAGGDAAAGKTKSVACAACHGADGNSTIENNPKLAGQHADYLGKQIRDFRENVRSDAVMSSMVAALKDQDIEDIAAYFAKQQPAPAVANEENLALGESIYRGGIAAVGVAACYACHGPAGKGNPASGYPALAGQHAAYTEKTLRDFRAATRSNDTNSIMRALVKRMTDEEIQAVSNYIQGLH